MEEKELKVTVKAFNVDWLAIKNACRQTISLKDSSIEPTEVWKRKLLVARHSPLRLGNVLVQIDNIPFYVMGHLVRHNVGCTPFVSTSREDRTNIPREERRQTDLVSMQMVFNIESLMNISEKRLCNCADKTTIKVWKAVLEAIREYDKDITWACVPSGIAHGGCTEPFGDCRSCNHILKQISEEERMDVTKRYNAYEEFTQQLKLVKKEGR